MSTLPIIFILFMTQLEIYKRQLEIAEQLLKNAKKSSEDISMYEDLYNLCKRSIEAYENNPELNIN